MSTNDSQVSAAERFSELYDSHSGLAADDSQALADLAEDSGLALEQAKQQAENWRKISRLLQQIPSQSVGAGFSDAVMTEIRREAAKGQKSQSPVLAPGQSSGQSIARVVAVVVATAAMLLIAISVATREENLTKSAEVLASFRFDPEVWDVVVVTVDDDQAAAFSEQLAASGDQGLELESVRDTVGSNVGEIDVLMASRRTSEKLIRQLGERPDVTMSEWNPSHVGELNREQLLRRFAESMKTPTQSDRFFGEVMVVVDKGDEGLSVRSSNIHQQRDQSRIVAAGPSGDNASVVINRLQEERTRPVLVVLKRKSEPDDLQGYQSQTQIAEPIT